MDYNNELNFGSTMTRDRELSMSQAFPVLMRKVYVWMSLALAITGITAFGVANSPGVMSMIFGNQIVFWGLVIAGGNWLWCLRSVGLLTDYRFQRQRCFSYSIQSLTVWCYRQSSLFTLWHLLPACSLSLQVRLRLWLLLAMLPRRIWHRWVRFWWWLLSDWLLLH